MPLVGVLCDDEDHKAEEYSFEECLLCAKNGGPRRCHNSYQVIKAMSQNSVDRKDAGLSATMILDKCPRKLILMKEEDYREHPSDMWPRIRGTVHHLLVENYSDGLEPYIAEQRYQREIEVLGFTIAITGKPDMILPERKLIIDYKSIHDVFTKNKTIRDGTPMPEHVQQINIYRWLIAGGRSLDTNEVVDIDIQYGGIQYMDMMNQYKCAAPIWSLEETEAFIIEKLTPIVQYEIDGILPPILYTATGVRDKVCSYCPVREICDARG